MRWAAHKLEALIGFHCGPTRHEIKPAAVEGAELIRRELVVHHTTTEVTEDEAAHIQQVFAALVEDEPRTALVCDGSFAPTRASITSSFTTTWMSASRFSIECTPNDCLPTPPSDSTFPRSEGGPGGRLRPPVRRPTPFDDELDDRIGEITVDDDRVGLR